MVCIYSKNFVVKLFAFICTVVILVVSPCARYFDALSIDTVCATGLEIPLSLGAEAVLDYLLAFFASLGVEETFRNREASLPSRECGLKLLCQLVTCMILHLWFLMQKCVIL